MIHLALEQIAALASEDQSPASLASHDDPGAIEALLQHAREPLAKGHWAVLEGVQDEASRQRCLRVHQVLCEYTRTQGSEGSPGVGEGIVEGWKGWLERNQDRLREDSGRP